MHPIVSIITPSFNRAYIIDETAHSIFAQTYPHWEWVIVDDGSTDDSWQKLENYAAKDKRVKIFKRHREPKGACSCRNIAIENSAGQYLIFLDTDDVIASFCLEQRVKAMQEDMEADFIYFPTLLFKQKPDDLKLLWNIDKDEDEINRLLTGDPICQGTGTIWKKESFVRIGMFNEQILLWQDIEMHLRAFLSGCTAKKRFDLPPDLFVRISDVSLSRTGFHSLPKLNSRMAVFKQTAQCMQQQNLLAQYRRGLRSMFCNIFTGAAGSNHFDKVAELLQLQKSYQLFSQKEQNILNRYNFARKYKLYKIPAVQNYLYNKIKAMGVFEKDTIGQYPYQKEIKV